MSGMFAMPFLTWIWITLPPGQRVQEGVVGDDAGEVPALGNQEAVGVDPTKQLLLEVVAVERLEKHGAIGVCPPASAGRLACEDMAPGEGPTMIALPSLT